ncbi:MAG: hypothetical protein PSV24_06870 [Rhodoferax sp.]|nr:hypothetical protein [Rhodoferax sp.]
MREWTTFSANPFLGRQLLAAARQIRLADLVSGSSKLSKMRSTNAKR